MDLLSKTNCIKIACDRGKEYGVVYGPDMLPIALIPSQLPQMITSSKSLEDDLVSWKYDGVGYLVFEICLPTERLDIFLKAFWGDIFCPKLLLHGLSDSAGNIRTVSADLFWEDVLIGHGKFIFEIDPDAPKKIDPKSYANANKPHASVQEANVQLIEFFKGVRDLRMKHKIAECVVMVSVNVKNEGNLVPVSTRLCLGDVWEHEKLVAKQLGEISTARRMMIRELAQGVDPELLTEKDLRPN